MGKVATRHRELLRHLSAAGALSVAAGIAKVNVGTRLNVACSAALRARLAEAPDEVDPRPALAAARDAMQAEARHVARLCARPVA